LHEGDLKNTVEIEMIDNSKEKISEEYHWEKKGYDQATALGPTLILEKLSSA